MKFRYIRFHSFFELLSYRDTPCYNLIMKNIVLIDGYSLIFRAYYAMPSLVSPAGTPTGAVYGFANMLISILENHKDAVIAVAYDRKEKTFRHELFADYKGTRKETDEDLKLQFPIVREMLTRLGIPVIEMPGFEADDIIGTLAKQAVESGASAYVYTGDKDALQLVQYGIHVNITVKGVSNTEQYDEQKVIEKMGVRSSQIVDFKSLRGDTSDNIPGAKGIGDKTAVKLLTEYGTTENIIVNADQIKPARISGIIKDSIPMIELSKTLATIVLDVPVSAKELENQTPDTESLRSMFQSLGFASLLKRLDKLTGGSPEGANSPSTGENMLSEMGRTTSKDKTSVHTFAEVNRYSPFLPSSYVPSSSNDRSNAAACLRMVSVFDFSLPFTMGIALDDDKAWGAFRYAYFVRDGEIKIIYEEQDFIALKKELENPLIQKMVFSSKELYLYCFSKGIHLSGVVLDVVIASYLVNPARKSYVLKDLAEDYGFSYEEREAGRQLSLLDANTDADVDAKRSRDEEIMAEAGVVESLAYVVREVLEAAKLKTLYDEIELPLVKVLADIEFTGFSIDVGVLREIGQEIERKIAELEGRILELAGEDFNISSPKQLGVILFEKLGLPVLKKNKTGYSTDKDVLEKLGEGYEIARLVIEYRSYTKLKSGYIDSLSELARDGKIHTSLNQTIAVTGRLSSTEPNLQNIPIRMEEGRNIRRAFRSEEGAVLLDADYSQIELRVLAHMSGDQRLIEAFTNGEDIHRLTASEVFGVSQEEVSPLQRSHAKEVNFGIIYGMGDFGLSESLKIPVFEARHYIEQYFRTYSEVKPFMDGIVESCKKSGYVETLFGRKRQIPELRVRNKMVQAHGIRMARNTVIQGTAADIIKIAMVRLYEELNRRGLRSKLILQIHDELILNVPEDEIEIVKSILRHSMETAAELRIPLKVDMQVASNWYDAK